MRLPSTMRAIVLGAAAGGGFPQWNSNAPACRRARMHDPAARARTQASLAVSNGTDWFLINASPDLRQQLLATEDLHPTAGLRSTPIAGVFLTSSEVDAVAGLLSLREAQPFSLYATAETHAALVANPIFDVLARDVVARRVVDLEQPMRMSGGLEFRFFAVPGKVPLYLEEVAANAPGDTIGVIVSLGSATLAYVPSCAAITDTVIGRLSGTDVLLFDGTLWADDEMIAADLGPKTGRRMGHMSISGADGVMAALASLDIQRKIFVHINNSNPVLLDDSPERAIVEAAGWTVAYDGMEIGL